MAEPWTPYDDKIAGPRYDHEDMCFDLGAQEGYRARLAEEHEPTLACVYCYEAGEANAHTDPLWQAVLAALRSAYERSFRHECPCGAGGCSDNRVKREIEAALADYEERYGNEA